MKKEDKGILKLKEKLGFGAFSMGTNIAYSFKSLYYLIFLTNVLKIPVLTAGTILTLGTIWDAVNDPLIGIFAANHTFKNGEKVRPFALWCSLPWAITLVLMFCDFKTSQTVTIILCLAIYFVYEALYTCLDMPYNSLSSLASNHDSDRKSVNAHRSLGSCLGSGIGSVAITPLVKVFGGLQGENAIIGEGDAPALLKTAALMGVIAVGSGVYHYFTSKERIKQESNDDSHITLIHAYKMLFKCKSWVLNMVYVICYGVNLTFILTAVNYYAAYVLGASDKATPILACYLVLAIVVSVLTPTIDRILGRKQTMIAAALVLLVGRIPFMINPNNIVMMMINAASVGIGSTMTYIMMSTNRNNIADIVEWQSGRRIDAMVAAGDNFASKLAEAGTTQAIAFALAAAGFNEALKLNQTEATIHTINNFLGLVPTVVTLVMLAILFIMNIEKEMNDWRPKKEK